MYIFKKFQRRQSLLGRPEVHYTVDWHHRIINDRMEKSVKGRQIRHSPPLPPPPSTPSDASTDHPNRDRVLG